ncbi:unnamed protein product, partial [Brachionus calyciflorus]
SKSSDVNIINSTTLQFNVNNSYLNEGESYYILFDTGVVKGTKYCGIKSKAIKDPKYWTFQINVKTTTTTISSSISLTSLAKSLETTVSSLVKGEVCDITKNDWFIFFLVAIGILTFLLMVVSLALCFTCGYLIKRSKIKPVVAQPIVLKTGNEAKKIKPVVNKIIMVQNNQDIEDIENEELDDEISEIEKPVMFKSNVDSQDVRVEKRPVIIRNNNSNELRKLYIKRSHEYGFQT